MSALPPKADIGRLGCNVRFVPKADIAPLQINLIVGAGEYGRRQVEAERLGSAKMPRTNDDRKCVILETALL